MQFLYRKHELRTVQALRESKTEDIVVVRYLEIFAHFKSYRISVLEFEIQIAVFSRLPFVSYAVFRNRKYSFADIRKSFDFVVIDTANDFCGKTEVFVLYKFFDILPFVGIPIADISERRVSRKFSFVRVSEFASASVASESIAF